MSCGEQWKCKSFGLHALTAVLTVLFTAVIFLVLDCSCGNRLTDDWSSLSLRQADVELAYQMMLAAPGPIATTQPFTAIGGIPGVSGEPGSRDDSASFGEGDPGFSRWKRPQLWKVQGLGESIEPEAINPRTTIVLRPGQGPEPAVPVTIEPFRWRKLTTQSDARTVSPLEVLSDALGDIAVGFYLNSEGTQQSSTQPVRTERRIGVAVCSRNNDSGGRDLYALVMSFTSLKGLEENPADLRIERHIAIASLEYPRHLWQCFLRYMFFGPACHLRATETQVAEIFARIVRELNEDTTANLAPLELSAQDLQRLRRFTDVLLRSALSDAADRNAIDKLSPIVIAQKLAKPNRGQDILFRAPGVPWEVPFGLYNRIDAWLVQKFGGTDAWGFIQWLTMWCAGFTLALAILYAGRCRQLVNLELIWTCHAFIQLLGFLGTVVGISTATGAIGGVLTEDEDAQRQGIQAIAAAMWTAFDTTFVGLVASMVVSLFLAILRTPEKEERRRPGPSSTPQPSPSGVVSSSGYSINNPSYPYYLRFWRVLVLSFPSPKRILTLLRALRARPEY